MVENGVTVAVGTNSHTGVNITTTTFYAGGQVYESKVYTNNNTVNTALGYVWQLQHVAHEEGRMRAVRPTPQSKAAITLPYDYMLKDHLGNPVWTGQV